MLELADLWLVEDTDMVAGTLPMAGGTSTTVASCTYSLGAGGFAQLPHCPS